MKVKKKNWGGLVNWSFIILGINLSLLCASPAQTSSPQTSSTQASSTRSDARKQLTIEQIFAEGGVTGRAPESIKWSPDGTKVSFVQRDNEGEQAELWYVDTSTREKKVLGSEDKLSQLAPPAR